MKDVAWDQSDRVAGIRTRIWQYLTPNNDFAGSGLLAAAALLGWPVTNDLQTLARLQFLLSREVGQFLDDLPVLLRKLSTTTIAEVQLERGRISGSVVWNQTLPRQMATRDRSQYVTAPSRRIYQTPENEMLVHVLDKIEESARLLRWPQEARSHRPAQVIQERLAATRLFSRNRMLSEVKRVPLDPRRVARVRSGRGRRRYASTLTAFEQYQALVVRLDRVAIKKSVEDVGLATSTASTIFELTCLFGLLDALSGTGWAVEPLRLFAGTLRLGAKRSADGSEVDLYYQALPPALGAGSRYLSILQSHGIAQQVQQRPDFTLEWRPPTGPPRLILVECKLSESRGAGHAARQALKDLLAYRRSWSSALQSSTPYGVGIAWGRDLAGEPTSEVMLCTPDRVVGVVSQILTI